MIRRQSVKSLSVAVREQGVLVVVVEPDFVKSLPGLVDRYLEERVTRRDLDPMTARNHRSALGIFLRVINAEGTLDERTVECWLEARGDLAVSTVRSQFSIIRTFCEWLHHRHFTSSNPARWVKPPRQPRTVPRALPTEKVTSLLAAVPDQRARAIVWVMVGMGLRCVETSRLEVGDWDRRAATMLVRGKFGNERMIPVPREVGEAIDSYLANHPATAGPLFRSYRNQRSPISPNQLSGMMSEWMRVAKVKRAPRDGNSAHALRHTAASDVLDNCGDLRVVQELLGHQNLASTSIYLRRAKLGQLREAMEGRSYNPGTVAGDSLREPIRGTSRPAARPTGDPNPLIGS